MPSARLRHTERRRERKGLFLPPTPPPLPAILPPVLLPDWLSDGGPSYCCCERCRCIGSLLVVVLLLAVMVGSSIDEPSEYCRSKCYSHWPRLPWTYCRPEQRCSMMMLSACTRSSDWPARKADLVLSCCCCCCCWVGVLPFPSAISSRWCAWFKQLKDGSRREKEEREKEM